MSYRSGVTVGSSRGSRAHGYERAREDVQRQVPRDSRRILDLGCSTGATGAALKARNGAFVFGVEIDPDYARDAEGRLDRVVLADVEVFLRGPRPDEAPFDCLIGADVFEHLVDPWNALARAADFLAPGASVVVSLPNVLWWRGLLRILVSGRWPRDDQGVFDRTHLRWLTRQDGIDLLEGAGLHVIRVVPNYWTGGWRLALTRALAQTTLGRVMAPQNVFVAVKP